MRETIRYLKENLGEDFGRLNDGYWAHLLKSQYMIDEVKQGKFNPENKKINPAENVSQQLLEANFESTKRKVVRGEISEADILEELSSWEKIYLSGKYPKSTFLGLRITTDCNLKRRCTYCDQKLLKNLVDYPLWKKLVDEVTENGERKGVFVGISGGEPLMDGEFLYGEQGLVKYAAERGAIVNINSNGHLITPPVVTSLVKSGLSTIHISLDSSEEQIHEALEGKGTFKRALEGIYSLQLAKAIFESEYPIVYVNTVATKENILHFDKLIQFLFQRRFLIDNNYSGGAFPDLRNSIPRLLPVGGERNDRLRPSEDEWRFFIKETLPRAEEIWREVLKKNNIPEKYHVNLADVCFFANPFKQKDGHSIEEIVEDFARGEYSIGRLCLKCYASPTQSYVTSDGNVYPCGSLSDSPAPFPIGNVRDSSLKEILKKNLNYLTRGCGLENPNCSRCYGSTVQINQKVEESLLKAKEEIITK